jgi:hypothetical protein
MPKKIVDSGAQAIGGIETNRLLSGAMKSRNPRESAAWLCRRWWCNRRQAERRVVLGLAESRRDQPFLGLVTHCLG